jgi:hypothetical protein
MTPARARRGRSGPAHFGCALLLVGCALFSPPNAAAGTSAGSRLALAKVEGEEEPTLILAQRTITRDWGTSDESTYVEISVPDWKSEGWAFALSGLAPGAGHAYLKESSGVIFALIEVGGWVARIYFGNQDDQYRQDAAAFRGNPEDSAAVWSFARWQKSTGGDPTGIRTLYEQDPEEFDVRIARDPVYGSGWSAAPPQDQFTHYLDEADGMLERRRYATTALWFNHLAAAFDAMRAARIHNFPLRQNLRIEVKTAWRSGAPAVRASVERSF